MGTLLSAYSAPPVTQRYYETAPWLAHLSILFTFKIKISVLLHSGHTVILSLILPILFVGAFFLQKKHFILSRSKAWLVVQKFGNDGIFTTIV